jgi:hypothetical protein
MTSPPIDRTLDGLHPLFRSAFLAWLAEAAGTVRHVDFRITETRRTLARQEWLYAQGRTPPFERSPRLTWTVDSRHRWGLAADIAMIRRETKEAIWEVSSWQWLYKVVPPEPFGLKHLAPNEWVHLEYRYADQAIAEAAALGLKQT